MGVAENGRPIENVKDRPNGHAITPVSKTMKAPRRSWTFWLVNNFAR